MVSAIFFGDPRFRYPIEPYILIFSAVGFFEFYNKITTYKVNFK